MRIKSVAVLLAALSAASSCHAQSAPASSTTSQILGVWRAEADGLPFATLTVTDEGGSLSGAILFYFHQRKSVNDPYTSTPGVPEPIFHPVFDGKTLTFQVSHRRAHPPRTLSDPPVTLTLRLTGADSTGHFQGEGELTNVSEHSPAYHVTKSDY